MTWFPFILKFQPMKYSWFQLRHNDRGLEATFNRMEYKLGSRVWPRDNSYPQDQSCWGGGGDKHGGTHLKSQNSPWTTLKERLRTPPVPITLSYCHGNGFPLVVQHSTQTWDSTSPTSYLSAVSKYLLDVCNLILKCPTLNSPPFPLFSSNQILFFNLSHRK